jgi:ribosome maturation factor RimP
MIQAGLIQDMLCDELVVRGLFLVEVVIKPGNKIGVFIDSIKGVTVDDCVAVSRYIESRLNRDEEDYELEVSSPGLDRPLKWPIQYEKNIGRYLEILLNTGIKIRGQLLEAMESRLTIRVLPPGKGNKTSRKKLVPETMILSLEEIKTAKVIIK